MTILSISFAVKMCIRDREKAEYLKEYEEIYEQIMAKRQCLSIKELAVTGTDLIADGMQPGKAIGEDVYKRQEQLLASINGVMDAISDVSKTATEGATGTTDIAEKVGIVVQEAEAVSYTHLDVYKRQV